MRERIKVGGILIAALAAVIAFDWLVGFPVLGLAVLLLLTIAAQYELVTMLPSRPKRVLVVVQTTAVAILLAAAAVRALELALPLPVIVLFGFLLGTMAVLVQATLRLEHGPEAARTALVGDAMAGVFSLAYVVLPMAVLAMLALMSTGGRGTLFAGLLVFISKCGDIGGYLGGSLWGKHRVMPKVSPKKSWEGSACGLLLTVAVALLVHLIAPTVFGLGFFEMLVLAILINVATQLGDFSESMLKRSCGVKDSADLIPTFGGALDVLDSLVFAVPVAALFLFAVA